MDAGRLAEAWYRGLVEPVGLLPEMHPAQAAFVLTTARHAAMIGGIGSGKTQGGCIRALRASQGRIGERRIATPNLGVVTAPTYDMLRDATLRTFYEIAEPYIEDFNKNEHLMLMKNGSEILWRSTEHPERLRGPSISWWFGDEAALYRPTVRKIMLGRLRQGGRLGYDWIATTPRGRNWVWQDFIRDADEHYYVAKATTRDNIFLDEDYILMLENEYSGDFALQELEGEFVAFEGLIYGNFARRVHVSQQRPATFARVVAGVDWGFANPGVILVIGRDSDGRVFVLAEQYATRRRVEEWAQIGAQLRDIWHIDQFYCDPSEPDNIRAFREVGLKASGADNSVLAGIQKVQNLLVKIGDDRARLTVSPECVHTIDEFEQYQWMENKFGLNDAPVKAHDHAMDALRYAIMMLEKGGQRREAKAVSYIGN
jgi:PBSX family phage terminase large subunit